ncbi:hypothetical protein WOC76_12470 [Methylocystis sp. IM3]|uniref:hypothetical protein n=1 Tax=Methylocystis sp. IM3 TaxID=3136722 RepID=UPI00311A88B0
MTTSTPEPKRRRTGKKPVDPVAVLETIAGDATAPAAARVSAARALLRHNAALAKAAARKEEPVASPEASDEKILVWRKRQ